ncbi:hypothetical protein NQ318_014017 [Aromia moschata]|uniref:non-specific serine/threonine protein kinase n=1 Tax=Aromia moschata TaxID=1265417 RepID=A0AAV8YX31_9CUCU|nr:hypothetical protein NQ318_014017 [Aromia moschata]
MKTMYEKANLIHADLSEDNVLWFEEYCYLIDAGQAVEPTDVNALQLLYKDCQKITDFFVKWKNVRDIFTADELFKYITSCYFNDEIANHVIGRVVGKTAPPQK